MFTLTFCFIVKSMYKMCLKSHKKNINFRRLLFIVSIIGKKLMFLLNLLKNNLKFLLKIKFQYLFFEWFCHVMGYVKFTIDISRVSNQNYFQKLKNCIFKNWALIKLKLETIYLLCHMSKWKLKIRWNIIFGQLGLSDTFKKKSIIFFVIE